MSSSSCVGIGGWHSKPSTRDTVIIVVNSAVGAGEAGDATASFFGGGGTC